MTRTVEHLKVMVVDDHQDGAEALGQVLAVMVALERAREAAAIVSTTLPAIAMAALGVAKADRLPTDVELRAAYCLKAIQLFTIPFPEQARSEMMSEGALNQLGRFCQSKD